MLTVEEHLDNLVRHIELVREAGLLLGKRLMRRGDEDFGFLYVGFFACREDFRNHAAFATSWSGLALRQASNP
jgi:hypothetical protein